MFSGRSKNKKGKRSYGSKSRYSRTRVRRGSKRLRITPRRFRFSSNDIVHYKLRSPLTALTIAETVTGQFHGYSVIFTLDQISSYTTASAPWDQYRINGVVFKIIPSTASIYDTGGTQSVGTKSAQLPYVHSCIDYTQNFIPGTEQQLIAYGTYKRKYLNKTLSYKFKPRPAVQMYQVSGLTSYSSPTGKNPWLSVGENDTEHYSFNFGIDNMLAGQTLGFNVESVYYVSFRSRNL